MSLQDKIRAREAKVAVIGLGYVGLPLAVEFARTGFEVMGIDIDEPKVSSIEQGKSYIGDVEEATLQEVVSKGSLKATCDFRALEEMDTVSICVPTPLTKTRDPDISYIIAAAQEVAQHLHSDQLIVLESTTYPGMTEEVLLPMFEERALGVGKDFYLAFSPERIDPGNRQYTLKNTPKVIGGITEECTEMAKLLYEAIIDSVVPVSSARAAELVKLLENTFRAVNIALANEIAIIADKLGVDVWEVIDAAATKPFGFMRFYPGPGLGGHCIPVDPLYLSWKLKNMKYRTRFIELADEINSNMPGFVVEKIADALNEHQKSMKGSRILILGVAYKKNVSDIRESPALEIIETLQAKGASVAYHDPYVPILHTDSLGLESVELTQAALADADCVVLVTDHDSYKAEEIIQHSKLIFDARNMTRGRNEGNIRRLGN